MSGTPAWNGPTAAGRKICWRELKETPRRVSDLIAMSDTLSFPSPNPDNAPVPAPPRLPVRAVTLFSAGVAYLLREGQMPSGLQEVPLTFRTTQINDILKSLVLLDDGGTVQSATYPSRDPVGRTLESFAVKVTENVGRAELLKQLRGVPVQVETVSGETLSGRVVGVETHEETVGGDNYTTVTTETLVLLGETGITAAALKTVRVLRILDKRLDQELRDALAALAFGSDDARRTVSLRFSGESERTVRVGYLVEAPLWKVAYRLVLASETDASGANEKPYLQGWAMVENTTDEDWDGVDLSLVSGRPVSFIQDLYQPQYVPRPVVPPDFIASPFPQTHQGDLDAAPGGGAYSFGEVREEPEMDFMAASVESAPRAMAMPVMPAPAPARARITKSELRPSSPAQTEAKSVGELFEYAIAAPVRLPRQQAALLPIVSEEIHGEKLSLFNAARDARFPMNAVRLKNTTNLHLKGGPVTLFDGGTYAGEARMEDIPPNDSRLLTYAVDLAVECEKQDGQTVRRETNLSIKRGVLYLTHKQTRETKYTIKNKAKAARTVLIEHPFYASWKLVNTPEPSERTSEFYRFSVSVPAGKTDILTVSEEQPVSETIALLSGSVAALAAYADTNSKTPLFTKPLHKALQSVITRRAQMDDLEAEAQARERERDTITTEQARIRDNMAALDKGAALYRRYTETLDAQETRLEALRGEITNLRNEADRQLRELAAYLDGLTV